MVATANSCRHDTLGSQEEKTLKDSRSHGRKNWKFNSRLGEESIPQHGQVCRSSRATFSSGYITTFTIEILLVLLLLLLGRNPLSSMHSRSSSSIEVEEDPRQGETSEMSLDRIPGDDELYIGG